MYCLLLQILQSDYIEENETFQGLLQLEIILKLIWRIYIRRNWVPRVLF